MLFCVSSFCSLTRVTKQIAIQLLQVRLTPSHYINFWHFWECPRSTSRRALTSPGHSCDVQGNVTALTTKKPCSWCSFRQPGWEKHVNKIWWDSNNGCNGSQLPCGLWKSVLCIKQVHAIPQSHLLIVNDSIWCWREFHFNLCISICIYIYYVFLCGFADESTVSSKHWDCIVKFLLWIDFRILVKVVIFHTWKQQSFALRKWWRSVGEGRLDTDRASRWSSKACTGCAWERSTSAWSAQQKCEHQINFHFRTVFPVVQSIYCIYIYIDIYIYTYISYYFCWSMTD